MNNYLVYKTLLYLVLQTENAPNRQVLIQSLENEIKTIENRPLGKFNP